MKTLWRYSPLILLALAWEIGARTGMVSTLALPPLSEVLVSWFELLKSGELDHQRRRLALARGGRDCRWRSWSAPRSASSWRGGGR